MESGDLNNRLVWYSGNEYLINHQNVCYSSDVLNSWKNVRFTDHGLNDRNYQHLNTGKLWSLISCDNSNSGLFCPKFRCHSNTGPFKNRTTLYHLNTRLSWYSYIHFEPKATIFVLRHLRRQLPKYLIIRFDSFHVTLFPYPLSRHVHNTHITPSP